MKDISKEEIQINSESPIKKEDREEEVKKDSYEPCKCGNKLKKPNEFCSLCGKEPDYVQQPRYLDRK